MKNELFIEEIFKLRWSIKKDNIRNHDKFITKTLKKEEWI